MMKVRHAVPLRSLTPLVLLLACTAEPPAPQAPEPAGPPPLIFTLEVPDPATQEARVEVRVPTGGQPAVELLMPVWSPGFYRREDYAGQVQELTAEDAAGAALAVSRPRDNRWRIETGGADEVRVRYRLLCQGKTVTTNWVSPQLGVFNGAATFMTLASDGAATKRPHELRLVLPASWPEAATALEAAPGGQAQHFLAPDFDTLVDSPILAGELVVNDFTVAGVRHVLAVGAEEAESFESWDGPRAAEDLEAMVQATAKLWGSLPFGERYVFLVALRDARGGLEHTQSTLMNLNPEGLAGDGGERRGYARWLGLASHEYFHAFNVKRLRPVELDPFDYEEPPRTAGLWVSEGFTSYYGELLLGRAGLRTREGLLASISGHVGNLQNTPGRLVQSLEEASLGVWETAISGLAEKPETSVSYYVKGPVVAFLLDMKIRRATDDQRSLDDFMRLAYERYGGERGFTAEELRATAEEVAGTDLDPWFDHAVSKAEELDYQEALDWLGLRFEQGEVRGEASEWKLAVREDATPQQTARLQRWLEGTAAPPAG